MHRRTTIVTNEASRGVEIAFSKRNRERDKEEKELIERMQTLELIKDGQPESVLERFKMKLGCIREHKLKETQIR